MNQVLYTNVKESELTRFRKIEEAARRMSQAVYEQAERQTDIYSGLDASGRQFYEDGTVELNVPILTIRHLMDSAERLYEARADLARLLGEGE